MLFRKRDDADRLIDLIRQEQKQLVQLSKENEAVKTAWQKAQRKCCESESLLAAHDSTYTRVAEGYHQEYRETLKGERDELVSRRDAIPGDLPQQIQDVKNRIFRRMSILSGALESFISAVLGHNLSGGSTPQCSPELQQELQAIRKEAESLTDPAELFALIERTTEFVEAEDTLQSIPLLRLDQTIQRALAVGAETASVAE